MAIDALGVVSAFDVMLLVLSLLIAMALHPAGLSVAERVAATRGAASAVWLAVGSVVLGLGTCVLGLTATLPARSVVPDRYPLAEMLLSAALVVSATAFALYMLRFDRALWVRTALAGPPWGISLAVAGYLNLDALGWGEAFIRDPALSAQFLAAGALGGMVVLGSALLIVESDRWRRWAIPAGTLAVVGAVPAAYYMALLTTRYAPVPPEATPGWFIPLGDETVIAVAGGALLLLGALISAATLDLRVRQRREETAALKRSEDRFRSLIQASAQIVWTTAPDGEMVGDQPSWAQFTGQKEPAYRGWGWFNAIHPEDREATASLWEESLANRKPVEAEHRLRRSDGQYRDCVARMVPVLERDGSVREWVGTHSDVTERARMQDERDLLAGAGRVLSSSLDERETLGAVASLLVPQLADWCAIDIRTADGGLERVVATHVDPHRAALLREIDVHLSGGAGEHGAARALATGESEMIREVTDEVLHSIAPDEARFQRFREVGVASLITVPLIARTQVLGVLTLALAESGEPYDLRDLALAEELARRSAIAIDNARLYSAARAAIGARDEVMGIVSHDLRNPLSTISMTADLLLDPTVRPEEHRRHLEIVQRAAAAMNRLICDLLDVSQSDSDRLAMKLAPTDPGPVVTEAWEAMQPLAMEKRQRLECDLPGRLPTILADATRVHQVLSNLLGNAIKFVEPDGMITLAAREEEGGVHFSVTDSGPGIPPEDLPHVFDRHWRAKETAHLGAGLGLAISRAIVEAHGGRIWVESGPEPGTHFHFTIPAHSARPCTESGELGQALDTASDTGVEALAAER